MAEYADLAAVLFVLAVCSGYAAYLRYDYLRPRRPVDKRLRMTVPRGFTSNLQERERRERSHDAKLLVEKLGRSYEIHRDLDAEVPLHESPIFFVEDPIVVRWRSTMQVLPRDLRIIANDLRGSLARIRVKVRIPRPRLLTRFVQHAA